MEINENQHESLVERLEDSMDDLDDSLDNLQNSLERQTDARKRMENSLEEMKGIMAMMFVIMTGMFLWILTKMNRVEELTSKIDHLEFVMNQSIHTRGTYTLLKLWIVWKVLCISYDKISSWYAERKGKQVSWREEPMQHNE